MKDNWFWYSFHLRWYLCIDIWIKVYILIFTSKGINLFHLFWHHSDGRYCSCFGWYIIRGLRIRGPFPFNSEPILQKMMQTLEADNLGGLYQSIRESNCLLAYKLTPFCQEMLSVCVTHMLYPMWWTGCGQNGLQYIFVHRKINPLYMCHLTH